MKKIYCVYCSTENNLDDKKCKKCDKKLNPKENLFKYYLKEQVKDNAKDQLTDNILSLLTNYIKSHLYGVTFSVAIIMTSTAAIVSLVNDQPIEIVESKPSFAIYEKLSIEDELVQTLAEPLYFNSELFAQEDFYSKDTIKYEDLSTESRLYMTYQYKNFLREPTKFASCDDLQGYDYIYNICLDDSGYAIGDDEYPAAFEYYNFDFNTFEINYHSIFGSDKEVPKGRYLVAPALECDYNKNKKEYLCYYLPAGYHSILKEVTKLVNAEKKGDTIKIYNRVIYIVFGDTNKIYKDRLGTELISDTIDDDNYPFEKGNLYVHTYKKDSKDNYYWYESKLVKE